MNKLLFTGDLHGSFDIDKLSEDNFPKQKEMDKSDILVPLGDVGIVWDNSREDKDLQKYLNGKNFTTFCVMGNHENYNLVEKYPIVDVYGGRAYQIAPSVYYAITGEIYDLNGYKCLVMNGAASTDKHLRVEGESWWPQEEITEEGFRNAISNLNKCDFKVDYILTHTGGAKACNFFGYDYNKSDLYVTDILNMTEYKRHYCGHYHYEKELGLTTVLYNSIIEIKE